MRVEWIKKSKGSHGCGGAVPKKECDVCKKSPEQSPVKFTPEGSPVKKRQIKLLVTLLKTWK